MKRIVLLLFTLWLALPTHAQEEHVDHKVSIREVEILGQRPMKEIGVQRTRFDSVVMKENIALSMADVLAFNSSIFVKSYGRASQSTVAFRGTSASHTQVLWNGMKINSPMLGMTDFSMIPSYFIDDASLLHGTSSVAETGGGLGGAVRLESRPANADGFGLQYIQGIGSFSTYDQFLRLTYGDAHWQLSTRVVYSLSENDFEYRNRDKTVNVYDELMNIVDQYYPIERNQNGAFHDFHLLQEAYYNTGRGDRLGLNVWYLASNREMPWITSNYADQTDFDHRMREQTLRSVLSWDRYRGATKWIAKAGYIHTWMAYDQRQDLRPSESTTTTPTTDWADGTMVRSRNRVHTLYGKLGSEWTPSNRWFISADVALHQHMAESRDKTIMTVQVDPTTGKQRAVVGYDESRMELSAATTARWRPIERFGMGITLREELYGDRWSPLIPALFLDGILSKRGNIGAKASLSRNYRFPTLNDLYFKPGGNPNLKHESGWNYDLGMSFSTGKSGLFTLNGSATWFESWVDDWIIWIPRVQGYYTPMNIKQVHAYGMELDASLEWQPARDLKARLHGTYSWTPSINEGEPFTAGDRSMGKQLPYVPEHSATCTAHLTWRSWSLLYKWCYYSERYTLTSNASTLTGHLPAYYMSDVTLEKGFRLGWADLSLKGSIRNLFDEEYISVLARPMPGINYEFFISITPKWGKKRN